MLHSVFSASGAERWGNCPGSIAMCQGLKSGSSGAAREGTAGHDLADSCLRAGTDPVEFIGDTLTVEDHPIEVTEDLALAVQDYVDYVRSIFGLRLSEMRVYYAELLGVEDDEAFGTTDCVIIDQTVVHIVDAKFGRHYVDPENNKQMTLYAAGVVDAMEAVGEEVTEVWLHIMQPRVVKEPRPFVMTRAQLAEAVEELRANAQTVVEANMLFTNADDRVWTKRYLHPGEKQCKFCPAAAFCPALMSSVSPFAAQTNEFEIVPLTESFPPQELAKRLLLVDLAKIWIKAVTHEGFRRLALGLPVPDHKLVTGREGNRKYADATIAEQEFADLPRDKTHKPGVLKTPAQLEKVIKEIAPAKTEQRTQLLERLEKVVHRAPARPTMTTANDPRPAWVGTADPDEFDDVD